MPITRRQPAIAFWASVRIWVPIWTGPTNRVTRNANASTSPAVMSPAKPSQIPTISTPALARPAEIPPSENENAVNPWARVLATLYSSIAVVDPLLGAVLDRVGADDGGADDRLGDRREQDADLAPDDAVRRGQLALEVAQREEQRREAHPHDERELPAVDQHDHGRDHHLADADDEDQAAEDQELADLVDVAGHARDQRAAALGVLGEQRQVVDVPERLDPQRGQAALGGAEQPAGHQVRREAGDHDRRGGHQRHGHGEPDVGTARVAQAVVEGLLDGDRHDHLADRRDDGEEQGERRALPSARASSRRRGGWSPWRAMSSPVSMTVPEVRSVAGAVVMSRPPPCSACPTCSACCS